jgi:hypothetical protein
MPRHNHKKRSDAPVSKPSSSGNPESTADSSRGEDPKIEYTLSAGQIIVEQNDELRRQDEELVDLEASVNNLREASIAINQEVSLHNRLLDDVHVQVDRVQNRQEGTQERLRGFMRRSGTCKLWLSVIGLTVLLVLLLVILK